MATAESTAATTEAVVFEKGKIYSLKIFEVQPDPEQPRKYFDEQALAELQGGRHFIERTFEDSKSHVGMAQYQVRKWLGWQHHMALVGLAMLFVLQERILVQTNHPLLSVADVVVLMNFYFMEHPDLETLLEKMAARHKRRAQLQRAATKRAQRQKIPKKT